MASNGHMLIRIAKKKLVKLYSNVMFYGAFATVKMLIRYLVFLSAKYGLRRKMLSRKIHDYSMHLSLDTKGISKVLYLRGRREDDHRIILSRELNKGDRVLDIGANIGYYALMEASLVGNEGRVFAVEPDPRNLELLTRNIELNGFNARISVYDIALSNSSGICTFALHEESNLNVVVMGDKLTSERGIRSVIKVKAVDVYEFIRDIGNISLIRMDLEGHEVQILEGVSRLLEHIRGNAPSRILFEAHPSLYKEAAFDMKKYLKLLFDGGYCVKTLVSADEKEPCLLRTLGYLPWKVVRSDLFERGLYDDVKNEDSLKIICDSNCIRSVLLTKRSSL